MAKYRKKPVIIEAYRTDKEMVMKILKKIFVDMILFTSENFMAMR